MTLDKAMSVVLARVANGKPLHGTLGAQCVLSIRLQRRAQEQRLTELLALTHTHLFDYLDEYQIAHARECDNLYTVLDAFDLLHVLADVEQVLKTLHSNTDESDS